MPKITAPARAAERKSPELTKALSALLNMAPASIAERQAHRRTISGRPLGWRGHRCETDGTSFRTLCGQDIAASEPVTLLCGDPEPNCDACFVAIGGEIG